MLEATDVPEAHYNLGVALEAQGRLDEARAEYERARALKPGLRQAAVNLGVLLEKAGDLRGAQAAYAAVVRDFPEDARARERLAALYLGAGQLDEAWRLAREALLRDPRSVGANKVLIRVAAQRNQLDLAKLIALRTAKLDAADPELPFLAGELMVRENDEGGAEAQFKKALALDRHFLPARSALLRAAVKRSRWAAAAEHAEALLQDRPGDPAVQLALGIALRHTGKPDDALAAYARAEELSGGKLAEVHLARGVLYMRVKNECEPALDEFRKYAQLAGPVAATESPVLKLQRECEGIQDENRKALEAAREMQKKGAKRARRSGERPGTGRRTRPHRRSEGTGPLRLHRRPSKCREPPTARGERLEGERLRGPGGWVISWVDERGFEHARLPDPDGPAGPPGAASGRSRGRPRAEPSPGSSTRRRPSSTSRTTPSRAT